MSNLRKYLLVVTLSIIVSDLVISQVKYSLDGTKVVAVALSYSRSESLKSFSGQLGYTRDGRVAIGTLFSLSQSTEAFARSFGVYVEAAIIRPDRQSIAGLDFLLAISRSWLTSSSSRNVSVSGVTAGIDFYVAPPHGSIFPFIQISGASASAANVDNYSASLGIGLDWLVDSADQPWIIVTPGVAFASKGIVFYEVALSLALSRSKK